MTQRYRLTKRSKNFNPHSPCGERLLSRLQLVWLGLFQSTLPLRGATPSRKRSTSTPSGFQSTLPLRGATEPQERSGQPQVISIHTPLAGSDCGGLYARHTECRHFNPHSPCGERPTAAADPTIPSGFQSTLPLRGATAFEMSILFLPSISIHTPLAGSDIFAAVCFAVNLISIHTPLAGSDQQSLNSDARMDYFNPHSPCGERPTDSNLLLSNYQISIHTPLAGSDVIV